MFLDIGVGIFTALFIGHIFDVPVTWLFIVASVAISLLPDIDILYYGFRKLFSKKDIYNHRSFTHYPIIYIPIIIILYSTVGLPYSLLFTICVYSHLIHDSFWLGWGVVWFWPFSSVRYKFFPDKEGKISSQVVMKWDKNEDEELFKRYHNPNWIRDFYFRPSRVAYFEYLIFFSSLIVLYLLY